MGRPPPLHCRGCLVLASDLSPVIWQESLDRSKDSDSYIWSFHVRNCSKCFTAAQPCYGGQTNTTSVCLPRTPLPPQPTHRPMLLLTKSFCKSFERRVKVFSQPCKWPCEIKAFQTPAADNRVAEIPADSKRSRDVFTEMVLHLNPSVLFCSDGWLCSQGHL